MTEDDDRAIAWAALLIALVALVFSLVALLT